MRKKANFTTSIVSFASSIAGLIIALTISTASIASFASMVIGLIVTIKTV